MPDRSDPPTGPCRTGPTTNFRPRFGGAFRSTRRISVGRPSITSSRRIPATRAGKKRRASSPGRPIPDKAEVALEYPDKFYVGTFERTARFEAHLDATGISLRLERPGAESERKSIHVHINYEPFTEILRDLARTVTAFPADSIAAVGA